MNMQIFIPITKVDAKKRLVYGKITQEVADKSDEILDYDSSKPHFVQWSGEFSKATNGKSQGNLRVMHTNKAAGLFNQIEMNDAEKSITGCAHVVDDEEWKKVEAGVYTGFSVGGKYLKRWKDEANPELTRYTAAPSEVSLVDNPCVPTAHFDLVKADGTVTQCSFAKRSAEPVVAAVPTNKVAGIEQVWKCEDGSTFATKKEALEHLKKSDTTTPEPEPEPEVAAPVVIDSMKALDALEAAVQSKTPKVLKDITKNFDTVSRFAFLLQTVIFFQQDMACAQSLHGHRTESMEKLITDIGALCDTLKLMVDEECKEYVASPQALDDDGGILALAASAKYSSPEMAKLVATKLEKAVKHSSAGAKLLQTAHDCMEQLGALCKMIEADPAMAGAASEAADQIAETVEEESEEVVAEKFAKNHSKIVGMKIQKCHDMMKDMGTICKGFDAAEPAPKGEEAEPAPKDDAAAADPAAADPAAADPAAADPAAAGGPPAEEDEEAKKAATAELQKRTDEMAKVVAERDVFKDALDKMTPRITELIKRVESLEAQPLPPKGSVRVVDKSSDAALKDGASSSGGLSSRAVEEALAKLTPEERATVLMKAALSNPIRVG